MKKGRTLSISWIILLTIVLVSSTVSAGIFGDLWNEITGERIQLSPSGFCDGKSGEWVNLDEPINLSEPVINDVLRTLKGAVSIG